MKSIAKINQQHALNRGWYGKQTDDVIIKQNLMPSAAAVQDMLDESCEKLRISYYRLALLLGVPSPHHIYHWRDGFTVPPPLFLVRLVKLHLMAQRDHTFPDKIQIDWENGRVLKKISPDHKELSRVS